MDGSKVGNKKMKKPKRGRMMTLEKIRQREKILQELQDRRLQEKEEKSA